MEQVFARTNKYSACALAILAFHPFRNVHTQVKLKKKKKIIIQLYNTAQQTLKSTNHDKLTPLPVSCTINCSARVQTICKGYSWCASLKQIITFTSFTINSTSIIKLQDFISQREMRTHSCLKRKVFAVT